MIATSLNFKTVNDLTPTPGSYWTMFLTSALGIEQANAQVPKLNMRHNLKSRNFLSTAIENMFLEYRVEISGLSWLNTDEAHRKKPSKVKLN